jgi:tetratricopeptide (TPR) repeat protein
VSGRGLTVALLTVLPVLPGLGRTADKLTELSAEIAKQPGNAALLLRRAEIHDQRGDSESAMADLDLAAALPQGAQPANVAAAELLYRQQQFAAALERLDTALRIDASDPRALRAKGRTLVALRRMEQAAVIQRRLLAVLPSPEPDDYLELAQSLAAGGRPGKLAGLRILDSGIGRLGPVVSLQGPAIALELELKRWDAAIRRVDSLAAASPRKDIWLKRRGEILLQAGRRGQARQAFLAALLALDSLGPEMRRAPGIQQLAAELKQQVQSAEGRRPPRQPISPRPPTETGG